MTNINKIKGALYGVAIGDALGGPLEFMSAEEIRFRYRMVRDMIGGGWLDLEPGETTDDTQMTIDVARGIVELPQNPVEAIGMRFVRWLLSGPKDVGSTCADSIRGAMSISTRPFRPSANEWALASYSTHKHTGGKTAGNGGLMRTVYAGLYYKTISEIALHAKEIARMTHFDPSAADDCATYSIMVHNLINCDREIDYRRAIIPTTIKTYFDSGMRYNCKALADNTFRPKPSGYIVDSFAAALHCIFTTDTFEDALIKAVNLGGDADTIGAICGGIAGALYGFDSIPERWTTALSPESAREFDALAKIAAG